LRHFCKGGTGYGDTHQSDHSTHLRCRRWERRRRPLKDYNLGNLGNTIAGVIGGVGGGQILQALIPAIASAAGGGLDLGAIVGQIVGGGAGGAILTIIAGLVKASPEFLTGVSRIGFLSQLGAFATSTRGRESRLQDRS
jgi:hypothetical protein